MKKVLNAKGVKITSAWKKKKVKSFFQDLPSLKGQTLFIEKLNEGGIFYTYTTDEHAIPGYALLDLFTSMHTENYHVYVDPQTHNIVEVKNISSPQKFTETFLASDFSRLSD